MEPRTLALLAAALAILPASLPAQVLVMTSGGPPTLTGVSLGTSAAPCSFLPASCPVYSVVPPFPAGNLLPSIGGEAVDEEGTTTPVTILPKTWVTDGVSYLAEAFFPNGCSSSFAYSLPLWPAGPCGAVGGGPAGSPIVAMSDAAGGNTLWVLNAAGLVSLVAVGPMAPLAQALAPAPILAGGPTGVSFDPATGLLWFVEATGLAGAVAATAPTGFACAPLPVAMSVPLPSCLTPPVVGITVDTTVLPGPIPPLRVTNGLLLADVVSGTCACPATAPAGTAVTDLDFAAMPLAYGTGCGCGPPTISINRYPVLGQSVVFRARSATFPGFTFAAFGTLFASTAPATLALGCGGCTVWIDPATAFGIPTPLPVFPGASGVPGCPGETLITIPIPAGAIALVGAKLYFQFLLYPVLSAPCGGELTDALEVTVGFP